jgi:NADH-quinone oxidoreductase subunit K
MNLTTCLLLSAALFAIGAFGLVTRRNMIAALMSLELMVNAALINFVAFARFGGTHAVKGDPESGSLFALFAVAVTAAEMALALAIVIALNRQRKHLDIRELDGLHG